MSQRPNLLFVFSDQHRWCDLGCYGNSEVATPAMDRLAREGVRFTTCISNAPLCVPARGSLLTGQLSRRHRAITNDLPITHDIESVAHVLNAAGYRTAYIGKWHLAGVPREQHVPRGPGRLGFETWKVRNCSHQYVDATYHDEDGREHRHVGYEPRGQTDLAIDFIEHAGAGTEPWALYLSWGPPHDPYDTAPEEYRRRYDPADLSLRPNVPNVIRHTQTTTYDRAKIRENLAGYYAHISALDDQLARLLEALDRAGQRENTIVVYTSDHGDMLGSQGLTNKQLPYEESLRVPLLISWPGTIAPYVCEELIGIVDLPVTVVGLMGLSFRGETDGHDLSALGWDPRARGRDACYATDLVPCHQAAARGGSEWRAIRTKQYTFVRTASDDGCLLYDNVADPYQQRNLIDAASMREVADDLRRRLNEFVAAHDELLPWDELIRRWGLVAEWNKSQEYFGLPRL